MRRRADRRNTAARLAGMDRLTLKLALAITVPVTALLGVGLLVLSQHHFNSLVAARREAAELQSRILEAAVRHEIMEGDIDNGLLTIVGEVEAHPEVDSIFLVDHDGVVRQASRPELVGQQLAGKDTPSVGAEVEPPAVPGRWTLVETPAGQVLRSVRPIGLEPECDSCPALTESAKGMLVMDVSLAGLQGQLARDRAALVAGTVALGLLLLASIGLIVRRLILVRLGALGRTARAIAAGDLERRAEVAGDDTIGRLALDFNEMANTVVGLVDEVKGRESQLTNVMNSVDDALVVLDRDLRVVAANEAAFRRAGVRSDALLGRPCRDALNHVLCGGTAECDCPGARCLATGEHQHAVFEHPPVNGAPGRVEEVRSSPVFDAQGKVCQVVEIWRDITDRVMEEKRLAEFQRLESLGALASGFSHEVNTPLATMLVCAEAIERQTADATRPEGQQARLEEIHDLAQTMQRQVLRCRKITEQFLGFAKGIPPRSEPVDLAEIVASIVALVTPTARQAQVAISVAPNERVPLVQANTEAVQHVLLNLLMNATQAYNGTGGAITLSYEVGPDVKLRIRDDGRGIPEEVQGHLFEPFHTSRRHGTGLGLFLSRGIMRRLGGNVRLVESRQGVGSCFEVVFQRAAEVT